MRRIILSLIIVFTAAVHVLPMLKWETIFTFKAQSLRVRVVSQAQLLLMVGICILEC